MGKHFSKITTMNHNNRITQDIYYIVHQHDMIWKTVLLYECACLCVYAAQ